MELIEKTLSRQEIFSGRIIHVHRDTVELPNGQEAARRWWTTPAGSAYWLWTIRGRALLVRQFRYPYGKVLREVPAGKLDPGEDPDDAIVRELREETGASAASIRPLGELYPSPGYCGEIIRMYLAQGLTFGDTDPDEDEFLDLERVPFQDLAEQVLSGEIRDAKTIAVVLKAKLLLGL